MHIQTFGNPHVFLGSSGNLGATCEKIVKPTEPTAFCADSEGRSTLSLDDVAHRIAELHRQVSGDVEHFAENVVGLGLEMLSVKQSLGHGKWLTFFHEHLERDGMCERHARRYLSVAAVAIRRIKQTGKLKSDTNVRFKSGAEVKELVALALPEFTDATTWRDLLLDFGLIRLPRPCGGAHPVSVSGDDLDSTPVQRRARAFWFENVSHLHKKISSFGQLSTAEQVTLIDETRDLLNKMRDLRKAAAEVVARNNFDTPSYPRSATLSDDPS